jgi:chemotaxis protein CheY-P-specific phosphatase CheC
MIEQHENHLKEAFEAGYENAAKALSKIMKDKIDCDHFHHSHYRIDNDSITELIQGVSEGSTILMTTEILGDISGKSYLLLAPHEFERLTEGIPTGKDPALDIKKEFVKELDNILSASVITKLSDHLGLKIYGDVPVLVGTFKGNIADLICNDFSEECEDIYISSTHFLISTHTHAKPVFIWAIDGKIIHILDTKLACN